MVFPDFGQPFIVEIDASSVALGAFLAQNREDGHVHLEEYASRKMNISERNYSTCEREALAVVFALIKYIVYLLSSKQFTLITDHQALRYAFQRKDVHGRLARWLDFLFEYEFRVEFCKGASKKVADYLSRFNLESAQAEAADEGELLRVVVQRNMLQHH